MVGHLFGGHSPFRSALLETQYYCELSFQSRKNLKIYVAFLSVELIMIAIGVLSSESQQAIIDQHLSLLLLLLFNMILSLLGLFISVYIPDVRMSELFAVLNVCSSITVLVIAKIFLSEDNSGSENLLSSTVRISVNVAFAASLALKHMYLLEETSFLLRLVTISCVMTAYIITFDAIASAAGKSTVTVLERFQTAVFILLAFTMFVIKLAGDEKTTRKLFLAKRKCDETDVLVQKLLPLSVLVTRYDRKEERLYFHSANRQIQRSLAVNDDDTMKALLMKVSLSLNAQQNINAYPQASLFQHLHLQARHQAGKTTLLRDKSHQTYSSQLKRKKTIGKKQKVMQETDQVSTPSNKNIQLSYPHMIMSPCNANAALNVKQGSLHAVQFSMLQEGALSQNRMPSRRNSLDQLAEQGASAIGVSALGASVSALGAVNNNHGGTTSSAEKGQRRKDGNGNSKNSKKWMDNFTYDSQGENVEREQNTTTRHLQQRNSGGGGGGAGAGGSGGGNSSLHEAEEIFDRVDVLQGVLIGENPKVLGIKIYTYELEDIHQVVILEEESLRVKVDYQIRLNRYYVGLFQTMLKKMRVPIAQSLYRMRKAIHSIKQSSTPFSGQQHIFNDSKLPLPQLSSFSQIHIPITAVQQPLSATTTSASYHNNQLLQPQPPSQLTSLQMSLLERIQSTAQQNEIIQSRAAAAATYIPLFSHDSERPSLGDSLASDTNCLFQRGERGSMSSSIGHPYSQNEGRREQLLSLVEGLQFCSFGILNNLFNYQDVFRILAKKELLVKPDHLSLQRVISDLKSIFQAEYAIRGFAIYFFNELSDDDSYINTDEKSLKQVLINLISNSLQSLSLSESKGHSSVCFRLNSFDEEVIDIQVVDSGTGFKDGEVIPRINLHPMNCQQLERNIQMKELKIGLAVSEKLVGRLGPYERVIISKCIVAFSIYRDYDRLLKKQQQQQNQSDHQFFLRGQSMTNTHHRDIPKKQQQQSTELQHQESIKQELSPSMTCNIQFEAETDKTDKNPSQKKIIANAARKEQIEVMITKQPNHAHYDFQQANHLSPSSPKKQQQQEKQSKQKQAHILNLQIKL